MTIRSSPCAAFAALLVVSMPAAGAAWKPERAIEIIAVNAPGGGSDRVSRIMTGVLRERRQIEVPIAVVNKPGAGGSVAVAYLNHHMGDGHYVLLAGKPVLNNFILGSGPSYTEFTQLAHLFSEYIAVTVKADSPLRNARDLVERMRKDPVSLSFGITGMGSPNHLGVAAALKEAGVDIRKVRAVQFPSGGAATTAMLGGHVDAVPVSSSFAAVLSRQGQVRVLAVSAPARLPGVLADVPTWREHGYEAVVSNWRALWGPKGLKEPQVAFWEEAMRLMVESVEWKKELEENSWMGEYLRSGEARKYLDRDYLQARAFLVELGLAKSALERK
jgi:putative tricarboxylic transport membrane protein